MARIATGRRCYILLQIAFTGSIFVHFAVGDNTLPKAPAPPPKTAAGNSAGAAGSGSSGPHVLGVDDEVTIWVGEVADLSANGGRAFTVDSAGVVQIPLVGEIRVAGKTADAIQADIVDKLKTFIRRPEVNVTVSNIRSNPVSVFGAVNTPGVQQLRGQKTLMELLSMAGGLRNDAGAEVTITRHVGKGKLPLPGAQLDSTNQYWVAEINLSEVMAGEHPEYNTDIRPHDVIAVNRLRMIYVVGDVVSSGGFPLNDRKSSTVARAIAMAGGLRATAATNKAIILNRNENPTPDPERYIDVKKILAGKAEDIPLKADDVLFIPDSKLKKITARSVEAALATVGGILIFRSAN